MRAIALLSALMAVTAACGDAAPGQRDPADAGGDSPRGGDGRSAAADRGGSVDGAHPAHAEGGATGEVGAVADGGLADQTRADRGVADGAPTDAGADDAPAMGDAGAPPEGFALALPLSCTFGDDCAILNYVDVDPDVDTPLDYACGRRSYDAHKGTDFAIRDEAQMALGVAVLAAAPGTVRAVRDEMPDVNANEVSPASYAGRECGNGLVVDHVGGWTTQYCHMKRGSLAVEVGQKVAGGQPLGEVGLSGHTEFPHLHLQLSRGGEIIDPFSGRATVTACGDTSGSLWLPEALSRLPYRPQLIQLGFADGPLTAADVFRGDRRVVSLPIDAPAIVLYAQFFGVEQGDIVHLRLFGPGGELWELSDGQPLSKSWLLWTERIGRSRRDSDWLPGSYRGEIELERHPGAAGPARLTRSTTLQIQQ